MRVSWGKDLFGRAGRHWIKIKTVSASTLYTKSWKGWSKRHHILNLALQSWKGRSKKHILNQVLSLNWKWNGLLHPMVRKCEKWVITITMTTMLINFTMLAFETVPSKGGMNQVPGIASTMVSRTMFYNWTCNWNAS